MTFLRKLNKALLLSCFLMWADVCLAKTLDRVVAKVNNDIITLSTIEDKVSLMLERHTGESVESLMQIALDMIIDEKLQLQEAKRLKIPVDDESVLKAIDDIKEKNHLTDDDMQQMLKSERSTMAQYKNRIKEHILVSKVVSYQLRNRINISEKEIKQYYATHQSAFYVPDQVHPQHILLIFDEKISEEQKQVKRKRAEEALKKIRDGEKFSEVAKQYSEDVSASTGGDLGFLERGKMVAAFQDAVFKLRPGEVSGIVETSYGLHIIRLQEVRPGRTKLYREVKDDIDRILFSEKREKGYKDWMAELRKATFIDVSLFETSAVAKKKEEESKDMKMAHLPPLKKDNARIESRSAINKNTAKAVSSKTEKVDDRRLGFNVMEKKLADMKELRKKNKISESEYQRKKEELLNQL